MVWFGLGFNQAVSQSRITDTSELQGIIWKAFFDTNLSQADPCVKTIV